jgi:hypothetical protein
VVNIAELAREYGVPWKSMKAHREQHLPTFLKVYGAAADLPSLGQLHAEALRVYMSTLDELGKAQAGVLAHIDDSGHEVRVVSHTAIARLLDGARKSVDQLARLAADGAEAQERPTGLADGELSARIAAQLTKVVARSTTHSDAVVNSPLSNAVHSVDAVATPAELPSERTGGGVAGGLVVEGDGLTSTEIPRDAVMALQTLPRLSPTVRKTITDDIATRTQAPHEDAPLITIPNPQCPLSPAASRAERTAAGYPDIEITLDDLRTADPTLLNQLSKH